MLALVVQLGFGRTINITTGPLNVAWMNLVGSIPVAATAALLIAVVRLAAYRLRGLADVKPPVVSRIAAVGLAVGLIAVAGVLVSDANPRLILGSGEGFMLEVMAVSSVGTVLVIVLAKSILYCLCLGGGIRGGPIFPAMFLGAATGTVFTLLHMPGEATALAASGVLAGTTVGIALGWRALIIGGVVIGLLLGSWLLIAPSIVGLVVGRVVGGALKHVPGVGPVPDRDTPATDPSSAVA